MNTLLLVIHGLVGVALLGAVTHQSVSLFRRRAVSPGAAATFAQRYTRVHQRAFTTAIIWLYVASVLLGAIIYPYYRLHVRIPFEEMQLGWAVGVFELKEHFAGIGLAVLPVYAVAWRSDPPAGGEVNRVALTLLLAFVVWWDFVIGHILNNIRGFA